jgi:hypothetical protein
MLILRGARHKSMPSWADYRIAYNLPQKRLAILGQKRRFDHQPVAFFSRIFYSIN